MKKRVLSILLVLIMTFSSVTPAFAGNTSAKREVMSQGIFSSIEENGFDVMSTNQLYKVIKVFRTVFGVLTGTIFSQSNLEVTVDETITGLCEYISDRSVLDVNQILTEVPDIQNPSRLLTRVIPVDITALRMSIYEYKDKLLDEGNRLGAGICHMIGAGISIIDKCSIYAEKCPDEGENVIAVKLELTLHDGSTDIFEPPLYINLDTGLAYGRDDKGMLSLGFNFDIYNLVAYATIHSWQREKGFCFAYDLLCYILPFYNYRTRRFRFEYADKEWMVQTWKGIYFFTTGAEVGLYNRDKGSFGTYYDCITNDEDMVKMSMRLMKGDKVLVEFPEQMNWWINGFKIGVSVFHPKSLKLIYTIEFYDEEMAQAFGAAVKKNVYKDVTCTVDGCKAYCEW